MNILEKIDSYLTEGDWKPGQWVVQKHPDFNIWMLLISKLKNGGWSAITIDDEVGGRNMAAKASIKGAYPTPEPTDEKNVPLKMKSKVEKKMKQLKINLSESYRGLDSQYLQKSIVDVIDDIKRDPDEKHMVGVLKWVKSRLNQSFPDGDVTQDDLADLLREPGVRSKLKRAGTSYYEIIDYIWMD